MIPYAVRRHDLGFFEIKRKCYPYTSKSNSEFNWQSINFRHSLIPSFQFRDATARHRICNHNDIYVVTRGSWRMNYKYNFSVDKKYMLWRIVK